MSDSYQTYQIIQQPKDNTYDFIFETSGEITNDARTKKLQRNAKDIVRLINVPFPPNLSAEDLIRPRNEKCGKVKVPNKFFIYRKWYTMCLANGGQTNYQTSISRYISEQWRNEPEHVKNYYGTLYIRAGELFKERYKKDGIKKQTPLMRFEPPLFSTALRHLPNNCISSRVTHSSPKSSDHI
ncbi:939_t:CDS:2 [Diversispora eburnea]|uniref:939_t:CDS:1 n=1 Tax=Diversispora eburnea TaxID=1213867 RepID=A0A9N9AT34_9GLOM|nr:939_t:CDS:2 [Diversispora eburnea]